MKTLWMTTALLLALGGCARVFVMPRPATETFTSVPGTRFQKLGSIAGTDSRAARRLSANVRAELTRAGINVEPKTGRWDSEQSASADICTRADHPVDGLLILSAAEFRLIDCESRKLAYGVEGDPAAGGPGITEMTRRLIDYLQGRSGPGATEQPRPVAAR